MSTVPAGSGGLVAVIELSELTVKMVAPTVPNFRAVAPMKPVPVMATVVPPDVAPEAGETLATTGPGAG
jgi:hypothetical protein